ncbi:MAG TPA: tetratricopeptide repeat protein [Noviherbaspirillum sp.]|nr:tetratricopeptide repeat protein [Noviherbaspirillum sp.]
MILNQSKFAKADIWFQRAFQMHQAGNIEEAETLYRKVLKKMPSDLDTLYLLGTACSQLRKPDDAEKYLRKALAINPKHPQALNNMGLTMVALRKEEEAIGYYERALAQSPDYIEAHNNLGNALQILDRLDEAEPHLRRALALSPNYPDALYNLGLVLRGKDRFEEAAQCFLRGIELDPARAVAYDDLGQIYGIWGRFEAALTCFDRAIALNPNSSATHNNRGAMLEELARYDEALAEYECAFELNPNYVTPLWNQAFLFLRQGKLDRGWEKHELRFEDGQALKRFPYPEWDGSSLEDKTILIYAEQGLGDEILFASCFSEMIARAKHCIIECEPRLAPLFVRSFPLATVVGSSRSEIGWLVRVPKIDVQIAAGSIPRFLRPTMDSFPTTRAYLAPDTARVEYWRSRLSQLGPGLKVGICWRSGLAKGARKKLYSDLSQWGEIFRIPGIHFVNLQYDECSDELREAEAKYGVTITNFPDIDLRNQIDESAALMAGLDRVVTAATAVCEIAGSIGIETFRLNPYGKQWEVLGRTDTMPWHPTVKLIDQPSLGDWDTQLAAVANVLREAVEGHTRQIEYISLDGGCELAVRGTLDDLATYVLKEQRGWYESEQTIALSAVQPDSRIVDVGAGIGVFSIQATSRLTNGRGWALTTSASDTDLLMKSRSRSQLDRVLGINIVEPESTLDVAMDRHGLDNITLVRIATEQVNGATLGGATRFFSRNSPLLMFGVRGANVDGPTTQWLTERGYRLYRYVPGIAALLPLMSLEELDAYTLNLFACKEDRAVSLERSGLLVREARALESLPGIDLSYWQELFATMPFAADLVSGWSKSEQEGREPNWEVYWMALNLYAMAALASRPASERYACLQTAFNVMSELLKQNANLPRLLSFCRMLTDLGRREAAVGVLNKVCALLNSGMPLATNEPFLPLADAFVVQTPGNRISDWVLRMILLHRENLRAFSTFFTGQESLPVLEEIRGLAFADENVDRRIELIRKRVGIA